MIEIKTIYTDVKKIENFDSSKYTGKIFIGIIEFVNEENYLCDVYVPIFQHRFDGLPIKFDYFGPRGFIGSIPEVGSQVLLQWPYGSENSPIILGYLTIDDNDKRFQLWRTNFPDTDDEFKTEYDLYLGAFSIDRKKRSKKLYSGDFLSESANGAFIYLSDSVVISNQRLNEIELRAADQTINQTSLNYHLYSAGIRKKQGLAIRNNEFGWLKSLGFKKTDYEKQLDILRQNHSIVLPDGTFHYLITINKADAENLSKTNPHNLDFLQTKDQTITKLPDKTTAPEFWGLDLQTQPSSSSELKDFAYVEDRLELTELHNSVLDIDDDLFDTEFPIIDEINPDEFGRKTRDKNLILIQNLGTLISNDINSEQYGRVLVPYLFSNPYSTKIEKNPYLTAKQYAEFSIENFKTEIEKIERRFSSVFHLSFPLNGNIEGKEHEIAQGGLKPPTTALSNKGASDGLKINLDSFIWGGQLTTQEDKYNLDPETDKALLPSYTRFDILKTGALIFNIAASDSSYGQLKGTLNNENFNVTGFGPSTGPGVSFTETHEDSSEKLGGWSIEGNIEGATKLILGRDNSRRISLALQTYGMIYGTIGNDLPELSSFNNPNEVGSNNSFNLKIEGKGRLFQGKNYKDGTSLEYRTDGRNFFHFGSSVGDIFATEYIKDGDSLAEKRDGKKIEEKPNGAFTKDFFNRKGGLINRTANTSVELATDGSIHIPFIGKELNSGRSLTIYTDGSIEIGSELEQIGANLDNGSSSDQDPTFNQSMRAFPSKAIQIRIGNPEKNGNSPLSKGKYKSGDSEKTYNREDPLTATIPSSDIKSDADKVRDNIKNNGVAFDLEIHGNVFTTIIGDEYKYIKGNVVEYVTGNKVEYIKGAKLTRIDGQNNKSKVEEVKNYSLKVSNNLNFDISRNIEIKGGTKTTIEGGGSQMVSQSGKIEIKSNFGGAVTVNGFQVLLG